MADTYKFTFNHRQHFDGEYRNTFIRYVKHVPPNEDLEDNCEVKRLIWHYFRHNNGSWLIGVITKLIIEHSDLRPPFKFIKYLINTIIKHKESHIVKSNECCGYCIKMSSDMLVELVYTYNMSKDKYKQACERKHRKQLMTKSAIKK